MHVITGINADEARIDKMLEQLPVAARYSPGLVDERILTNMFNYYV